MGGSSSGPRRVGDVKSLIERAKQELRGKRNVFISFAYEDVNVVNLLRAQAKNENSPIEFNDWSVSEPYDSDRAGYIKQRISERIAQSSLTVVYVSSDAARSSWVDWEIRESVRLNKRVVGVFSGDVLPADVPAVREMGVRCVPWAQLAATVESL